jgi:hypothetical protein
MKYKHVKIILSVIFEGKIEKDCGVHDYECLPQHYKRVNELFVKGPTRPPAVTISLTNRHFSFRDFRTSISSFPDSSNS